MLGNCQTLPLLAHVDKLPLKLGGCSLRTSVVSLCMGYTPLRRHGAPGRSHRYESSHNRRTTLYRPFRDKALNQEEQAVHFQTWVSSYFPQRSYHGAIVLGIGPCCSLTSRQFYTHRDCISTNELSTKDLDVLSRSQIFVGKPILTYFSRLSRSQIFVGKSIPMYFNRTCTVCCSPTFSTMNMVFEMR